MTEQEMEMWQRIDIMGDRLDKLEKDSEDKTQAFVTAINLIAELLKENRNGE